MLNDVAPLHSYTPIRHGLFLGTEKKNFLHSSDIQTRKFERMLFLLGGRDMRLSLDIDYCSSFLTIHNCNV